MNTCIHAGVPVPQIAVSMATHAEALPEALVHAVKVRLAGWHLGWEDI